ncbi:MAG: carbon-nitrogen hydrolase family protein [Paracoccaceae bacterium]
MRAALLQMTSSDDPGDNARAAAEMARRAAGEGAALICTPEVTNCVSASRTHQRAVLGRLEDDPVIAALARVAEGGAHVAVGSVALAEGGARLANRSVLLGPGGVVATYDKIHMFDVALGGDEDFTESAAFAPGDRAVVADAGGVRLGLTVCYDLRFPQLHRALAQAGAQVILSPAAFSPATGPGHWEVLLRARAIETGAWVLAAAQTGTHPVSRGRARRTHGHSLAVDPWGRVVADAGTAPGPTLIDLDLDAVAEARRRIPALTHDRAFAAP